MGVWLARAVIVIVVDVLDCFPIRPIKTPLDYLSLLVARDC
jgi:hypothetical protein